MSPLLTHICRPPAAFKNLKSLSAGSPGHLLLLEYLEERPLLMLQPGMGMRLTTYYRCVCPHLPLFERQAGRWWLAVMQIVMLLMLQPGMGMHHTLQVALHVFGQNVTTLELDTQYRYSCS
jgi:hypothetical protein